MQICVRSFSCSYILSIIYEEEPVEILDRKDCRSNKRVPTVKVLWTSQLKEEATWECEDVVRLNTFASFPQ